MSVSAIKHQVALDFGLSLDLSDYNNVYLF